MSKSSYWSVLENHPDKYKDWIVPQGQLEILTDKYGIAYVRRCIDGMPIDKDNWRCSKCGYPILSSGKLSVQCDC